MFLLHCSRTVCENEYPVLLYLLELCLLHADLILHSLVMGCEALDTWYSILLPLFCLVYLFSPSFCDGILNVFEVRIFNRDRVVGPMGEKNCLHSCLFNTAYYILVYLVHQYIKYLQLLFSAIKEYFYLSSVYHLNMGIKHSSHVLL